MRKQLSRKVLSIALGLSLSLWCVPSAWADAIEPSAQGSDKATADVSVADAPDAKGVLGDGQEAEAVPDAGAVSDSGEKVEAPLLAQTDDSEKSSTKAEDGKLSAEDEELAKKLANPQKVLPDGAYTISSALPGSFALDVDGASSLTGANVQIWAGNDTFAQRWYLSSDEDGYYTITSYCSGLVLDVADGGKEPGTNVRQCTSFGNDAQKWILVENDDGTISLYSKWSKLALDVSGARAENGTNVLTWTPNSTQAQKFSIVPAVVSLPEGIYSIKAQSDQGKLLDVQSGSRKAGANVQLWGWNGTLAQKWKVTCDKDGLLSFESLRSGKMLTAVGGTAGANVAQEEKALSGETPDNQKWVLSPNASGGFALVSKSCGLALDLDGASTESGTNVQVWTPNGTKAQGFVFKQVSAQVADGCYTVDFSRNDSMKLDVTGASRDNGANVQLFTGNGTRAQVVRITSNGDGTCEIAFPFSRKVLDAKNAVAADGTNVQQWERNGSAAQKWVIEYAGSGSVRIKSALGDFAIEVAGNSAVSGANIQLGAVSTGGVEQLFTLTPTTYVPEDFADHMAHFETYSSNTINGWYNMSRALSNFDGMVVQPGQTVSFFDVCGPCGAAEGYLIAGVVGGEGYGGGICQASTTLYGAVLRAGLTIVERQNHTTPSKYVPIGQDAMVNWGTSDFRFRNDWDFPVKIVVDNHDRTLNCDIWGIQPDWYDTVEVTSWWTGSNSAAGQREYYKNGALVHTSPLPNSWYW